MDIASDDIQCDFVLGVTCIRHGYWLGKINADNVLEDTLSDTAPCQYPYCKTDLPPCPIIGLSQAYNQLPIAQGEQCNGLLCRHCREDAVFSFEAVNCIPSSNCKPWQPYATLVLVVVFQLVLGSKQALRQVLDICMDLYSSLLYSDSYLLDIIKNLFS